MQHRMKKDELEKLIDSLKINRNEFWILSSSALVLRDIYPDAGDLDIAVTQKGLEELKCNYELKEKQKGWYIVTDNIECVLANKEDWEIEKFGKYNLESIENYYTYLQHSQREKDRLRIPIVEEYIKSRKDN